MGNFPTCSRISINPVYGLLIVRSRSCVGHEMLYARRNVAASWEEYEPEFCAVKYKQTRSKVDK